MINWENDELYRQLEAELIKLIYESSLVQTKVQRAEYNKLIQDKRKELETRRKELVDRREGRVSPI